jgi:hydrogenase expression/formation protein HypE
MIGKVSPSDLAKLIFPRLGFKDPAVIVGPRYGEDACGIELGNKILVASTDPIIFAEDRIGRLGVNIACNDVAASGAQPRWLLPVYFIPDDGLDVLDKITRQVDEEARRVKVAVVGGHTEIVPKIRRPLLSMTCLGIAKRFIKSSGAKEGDIVIMTKSAAIEGTGIIASDFKDSLLERGMTEREIEIAVGMLDRISVVNEAITLSKFATSMHDPTEGGLLAGAYEIAEASGVELELQLEKIPVDEISKKVCRAMGVDPLRIFASGALLATVPRPDAANALRALIEGGVEARAIGEVKGGRGISLLDEHGKAEEITGPVREEMYSLWHD